MSDNPDPWPGGEWIPWAEELVGGSGLFEAETLYEVTAALALLAFTLDGMNYRFVIPVQNEIGRVLGIKRETAA